MASLLEYTCPNCGGNIKYDAAAQSFMCESCDSEFTEQQLKAQQETAEQREAAHEKKDADRKKEAYDWNNSTGGETMDEMNMYSCRSCGAQITTDPTTVATQCPYCTAPVIMTGKVSGLLKPDCVIPFKLDKKGAIEALKNHCKGKFLLPSNFISDNKVDELKGLYVPFWLFDSDIEADMAYAATKTRLWSDSKYNYTETSFYKVYRRGEIGYADIPVDGSQKMRDDYMDGIEPFDYADMTQFSPAYLSGFMADKYDVSAEDSFTRAETRIKNTTEDAFRSTVQGYDSVKPERTYIYPKKSSYKYSLLPVYMMNLKYGDKLFTYAINGQTGRVSGELPIDKKKTAALFAGVFAGAMALAQILVFFFK